MIDVPTRRSVGDNVISETTLDLLFTNCELLGDPQLLDFNIRNHLKILTTRKKISVKSNKIDFRGRSYRYYDREVFQDNLTNSDWEDFYRNNDPNWLWDFVYNNIPSNIEPMCPMKTFKVAEFKEVWMTNEAVEAIKDKERAVFKARRTRKVEDWARAREMRNRVGWDIENFRADYLKNQQEVHKSDPKTFWKNIASTIPGKKGSHGSIWLTNSRLTPSFWKCSQRLEGKTPIIDRKANVP